MRLQKTPSLGELMRLDQQRRILEKFFILERNMYQGSTAVRSDRRDPTGDKTEFSEQAFQRTVWFPVFY